MTNQERIDRLNEINPIINTNSTELYELECKIRSFRYKIQPKYNKMIEEEVSAEFGTAFQDLQKTQTQLTEEQRKLNNEITIEKNLAQLKAYGITEGETLYFWTHPKYDYTKYIQTKSAIVQIFREGDEYPDNCRWDKPSIGDIILRYLKNNGTPGKKIERYGYMLNKSWFKLGVDPNEQIKAEKAKKEAELNLGVGI